ncbi:hypothetical protein [Kineococcus rhizosphaerae]|uniref:Capsular polysaccharide biosynthesis protein n=1 Tax=Kineococcus rhizosphaerae TaxID=559628 RepID=A0A2T0RB98_9ACTN|nr:hypothetical protein [Kineococcus rhizosphaerae]PRY18429.1 hypothetical protein CLV37_101674 [Kineococcus rhizosphaerae]
MTTSQALAALRRALVPALVTAVVVFGALLLVLGLQSPTYQARVGLVAVPVPQTSQESTGSYGEVVALVLPALPELVVSAPVRQGIERAVPAGQAAATTTTVELVPSSAVARITVTAPSAEAAEAGLQVVVAQVQGSGVLDPVGAFRVVGDVTAPATALRPDRLLSTGLALLAAAVAAVLAVAAVHVLRPRVLTVGDVERIARRTAGARVPVELLRADGETLSARMAADHPRASVVRVFASDQQEAGNLAAVQGAVRGSDLAVSGPSEDPAAVEVEAEVAIVTATLRRTTPQELTTALLRARASGRPLGAVVVS